MCKWRSYVEQNGSTRNNLDKGLYYDNDIVVSSSFLSDFYSETCRYKVGCDLPGKYRVALDSDAREFGGLGRVRGTLYTLISCVPNRLEE